MSYALIDTTDLTTLGNSVRAKTGGSSQMTISEMATAISNISSQSGGWTPTTLSTIPRTYITSEKYSAGINFNNYTNPFIAFFWYYTSISFRLFCLYFDGSTYTFLSDETAYDGASISNGIVTAPCDEPNCWAEGSSYFYIIT